MYFCIKFCRLCGGSYEIGMINMERGNKPERHASMRANQRRKNRVLLVILFAFVGLFYLLSVLKYLSVINA